LVCDVQLTVNDAKQFIEELEEDSSTEIPKSIRIILESKACRGAIMFGDYLDRDTCHWLISELASCNLPFQCAHGRPTMTILYVLPRASILKPVNVKGHRL
jgi:DNA mismatch repair protein MLH3